MKLSQTKYTAGFIIALIIMGAMSFHALASDSGSDYAAITDVTAGSEFLEVNAVWIDEDMLRIDVTDSFENVSSFAVRLSDFVSDTGGSPYILIQTADDDGNLSAIIRVNNPFHVADGASAQPAGSPASEIANQPAQEQPEPPNLQLPAPPGFTPDGTGTVADNVVNQNGVEFFTIFSEAGNEFFLVVDRQRNSENVYLLNAVTEADLMALAENSGNPITQPPQSVTPPFPQPPPPDDSAHVPPIAQPHRGETPSRGNLFLILIIILGVGGAAYYIKIVKPKKNANSYEDENDDIDESGDDYDYDNAAGDDGEHDESDGDDE